MMESELYPVPIYTDSALDGTDVCTALLNVALNNHITLPILRSPPELLSSPVIDAIHNSHEIETIHEEQLETQISDNAARGLVRTFFEAIQNKNSELVAIMIDQGIVTAETRSDGDEAPLFVAIEQGNLRMVQQLVIFGANVNAFEPFHGQQRTGLMVAAAEGNLRLVKWLVEVCHADDALVAPDGALALRLAAEQGHTDVVRYLPGRRGGGWKRWKTQHARSMEKAKKALRRAYQFFRFMCWDLPRFLVSLPLKGLQKSCRWCWHHRKRFGPWCANQVKQTPERIRKGVDKIRLFVAHDLLRISKNGATYTWRLLTQRIPEALKHVGTWLWKGVLISAQSMGHAAQRFASLAHTTVLAIITRFQQLTIRDIGNALVDLAEAIFVSFPRKLCSWIARFGDVLYKSAALVAASLGKCLWWIGAILLHVAKYVPRQMWIILSSVSDSGAQGVRECLVWINPKFQ